MPIADAIATIAAAVSAGTATCLPVIPASSTASAVVVSDARAALVRVVNQAWEAGDTQSGCCWAIIQKKIDARTRICRCLQSRGRFKLLVTSAKLTVIMRQRGVHSTD